MTFFWHNLWHDETGLTTVEYALILCLVTLVGVGAWAALGDSVRTTLTQIGDSFGTPPNDIPSS